MQFYIRDAQSIQENCDTKVFVACGWSANHAAAKTDHYLDSQFSLSVPPPKKKKKKKKKNKQKTGGCKDWEANKGTDGQTAKQHIVSQPELCYARTYFSRICQWWFWVTHSLFCKNECNTHASTHTHPCTCLHAYIYTHTRLLTCQTVICWVVSLVCRQTEHSLWTGSVTSK